jgi:YD repeat-containing protein
MIPLPQVTVTSRTLLFCVVLALHSQVAYGQADEALMAMRQKNRVKTQTTWQRNYIGVKPSGAEFKAAYGEYNKAGELILEKTFSETPDLLKQYKAVYNADNRLVKEVWKESFTDSAIYKYDESGQRTEEFWYWGQDKAKDKISHTYDATGHMISTVSKYAYGSIIDSMFYDDDRLALIRTYDENDRLSTVTTNTYNAQGKLREEIKTNTKGELVQKITRDYYGSGLLKSIQTSYYSTANVTDKIYGQQQETYKYERGLLMEQIVTSKNNGEMVVNYQASYEYNDKGLATALTSLNLLSKEKSVFRYAYTFWE